METFLKCQSCSIREFTPIKVNLYKPNKTKISKYYENKDCCQEKKENILKLLSSYGNNIQENLYESDNVININDSDIQIDFPGLFYLSLLLYKSNLINFIFSINLIKNLDSIKEENYIAKIILSKIIIIFIDYAKGLDYSYQNQNQDELEKIKIRNIGIIIDNLEIFNKEFNLKYYIKSFLNKNIDYIYLEIIISLINKNKFNNMDYYKDIFKQLNLESINITQIILDGLSKELDINKNKFLKNYMINEDRLEDQKVINFYEILFNNILKNPEYIYINNFLIINRNNFFELLIQNTTILKFLY